MRIQLSDHFTYKRLIRFVMSSVLMMIFTSLYSIVDGFFVSNYVGKKSFAAVNLVMPVCMAMGTIGMMIGTGGSAVVSQALGEGKRKQANRYFSMLVYFAVILSLILSGAGFIFACPVSEALGAEGKLLEYCVSYSRILIMALTAFVLQNVFMSFFVTAEKPALSLAVSVIGYHYGAGNHDELKNLFRKSVVLMSCSGIILTFLAEVLTVPLVKIFASYDVKLFNMTCHGFRIYSIAFIFMGINVWGSAFFTALGNGVVSAVLSFLRTLVFQIIMILVLPVLLGIDGVWGAIVSAEFMALVVTCIFIVKNRRKYGYM